MSLRVLYACSEVFPLLKTGGLADVSAGLPPALAAQGADVRLLLPAFPSIVAGVAPEGPSLLVPGGDTVGLPHGVGPRPDTTNGPTPWLRRGRIEASGLPVWLLHAPGLYDRPGNPYQDASGKPWPDAAEQFAWLGWAAALLGTGLDSGWVPDVVHGHDWHTGLAFAYLNRLVAAGHRRPASVFTVHNLAYQGVFGPHVRERLGLPDALFHLHGLEFHGQVSFMKAGLQFADAITTVSPTYAREITGEEQGCGLDGVLRERRDRLHGILNGVDDAVWDPANDALVQPGYSADDQRGKAAAKARLQQRLGLRTDPDALLFCVVSRLTEQKGLHLLPGVVDELVRRGGQLAVLGAGDPLIEQALQHAAQRHPGAVGLHIGYDEGLAHTVIAGSDVILVPSRFEPCGLTQLYGLRYGTLPLVRAVGGLVDTVTDSRLENIDDGSASGFVFHELSEAALLSAIRRAFALRRREADWRAVQRHAMSLRFDWARAASDTLKVYALARSDATGTASA
ncbi:glycogen synthase GlgA [Hydrogenophaga luteola]|uniref:Glycogen synthase n=1 Tax=Hydrogenophaga luteola TaxID=1591122 RepID=A0ABV7WAN1_9BURK